MQQPEYTPDTQPQIAAETPSNLILYTFQEPPNVHQQCSTYTTTVPVDATLADWQKNGRRGSGQGGSGGRSQGTHHLLSTTAVFTVDMTISLPTRLDSNCVSEWVKNMGKGITVT